MPSSLSRQKHEVYRMKFIKLAKSWIQLIVDPKARSLYRERKRAARLAGKVARLLERNEQKGNEPSES